MLHDGLVVVIGTQLHVHGLFPMTHAISSYIYLPCVPGVTINLFVLSSTSATIIMNNSVPFLNYCTFITPYLHVVNLFH